MNFLRRDLAPISQSAWAEIDSVAKETLSTTLSGRRIVTFDGPHGLARSCVPLGRLSVPHDQKGATVHYGVHQVLPLVETRVPFRLPLWELDNADRGAKGIQLDALVKACHDIASFENKAVFDGFEPGKISGLLQATEYPKIEMALNAESIIDALSEGRAQMLTNGVSGPAHLAVSIPLWSCLAHNVPGGTLRSIVERQIGGNVVFSADIDGALLVSARGGDAELTVGQDIAIGYSSATHTDVDLYLTESFTFRVIAPEAVVGFMLR